MQNNTFFDKVKVSISRNKRAFYYFDTITSLIVIFLPIMSGFSESRAYTYVMGLYLGYAMAEVNSMSKGYEFVKTYGFLTLAFNVTRGSVILLLAFATLWYKSCKELYEILKNKTRRNNSDEQE